MVVERFKGKSVAKEKFLRRMNVRSAHPLQVHVEKSSHDVGCQSVESGEVDELHARRLHADLLRATNRCRMMEKR